MKHIVVVTMMVRNEYTELYVTMLASIVKSER